MPGVVVFADRLRLTALRRRADHFNSANECYPGAGGVQGEGIKNAREALRAKTLSIVIVRSDLSIVAI
jgi:hypothetical protein